MEFKQQLLSDQIPTARQKAALDFANDPSQFNPVVTYYDLQQGIITGYSPALIFPFVHSGPTTMLIRSFRTGEFLSEIVVLIETPFDAGEISIGFSYEPELISRTDVLLNEVRSQKFHPYTFTLAAMLCLYKYGMVGATTGKGYILLLK